MAVTEDLIVENQKGIPPAVAPPKLVEPEKQIEIVNGMQEIKEMAGAKHSGVGTRLLRRIGNHTEENRLGEVYGSDASFTIGENERMPDISFVSAERIPEEGEPETAWPIAPDLAIEIISPNDVYHKVLVKIDEYFKAGVKQVWLVEPSLKRLTIYSSPKKPVVLTEEDELVCEDVLPGFRCHLSELFTPAYVRRQ